MGMYVQVFVVPRGTRDNVIFSADSYRNHFYTWFEDDPRIHGVSGGLFVKDFDSDRPVVVVTPDTYLKRVNDYCHEINADTITYLAEGRYEQPGWMYADKLSLWLWARVDAWSQYEIVITEET